MAFLDKLNELARSAGEKTNNAIESGKLSLKISTEEKKISAAVLKLGELLLAKLDAGEICDESIMQVYSEITSGREAIAQIRQELDNLKAPKEDEAASAAPAAAPAAEGEFKFCTSCGAKLDTAARFCSECGKGQ